MFFRFAFLLTEAAESIYGPLKWATTFHYALALLSMLLLWGGTVHLHKKSVKFYTTCVSTCVTKATPDISVVAQLSFGPKEWLWGTRALWSLGCTYVFTSYMVCTSPEDYTRSILLTSSLSATNPKHKKRTGSYLFWPNSEDNQKGNWQKTSEKIDFSCHDMASHGLFYRQIKSFFAFVSPKMRHRSFPAVKYFTFQNPRSFERS